MINLKEPHNIYNKQKRKTPFLVMTNNEVLAVDSFSKNVSNFHTSMQNVVFLAQIFGAIPVNGIKYPTIDKLHFQWMTFKTFYSIFAILSICVTGILYFLQFIREEMNLGSLVSTVFYLCQSCGYILFIKLASKWHFLNKEWLKMEKIMEKYSYKPNFSRRCKVTTIIIMALALLEHIFSTTKNLFLSGNCPIAKEYPAKAYFGLCCTNVFSITPYAHWKAALTEIPIIMSTFIWSFIDLFIILCSSAMAERFRQINKQIAIVEVQNQQFWKETREDYTHLWNLCRTLDSAINNFVTLSFGSNLFFICWQMFNSLKPKNDIFMALYFIYSFGFLLGRTTTVSIYCCWINNESKEILTGLFNIPQQYFSVEADRLINQICSSPAVITGSNFFAVTRGLCLQVASAIITFEIILVQIGPSFLKTDIVLPITCIPSKIFLQ